MDFVEFWLPRLAGQTQYSYFLIRFLYFDHPPGNVATATAGTNAVAAASRIGESGGQGREGGARLLVNPPVTTMIRVFMVVCGVESSSPPPSASLIPQSFPARAPIRRGFTAVEWGGTDLSSEPGAHPNTDWFSHLDA